MMKNIEQAHNKAEAQLRGIAEMDATKRNKMLEILSRHRDIIASVHKINPICYAFYPDKGPQFIEDTLGVAVLTARSVLGDKSLPHLDKNRLPLLALAKSGFKNVSDALKATDAQWCETSLNDKGECTNCGEVYCGGFGETGFYEGRCGAGNFKSEGKRTAEGQFIMEWFDTDDTPDNGGIRCIECDRVVKQADGLKLLL